MSLLLDVHKKYVGRVTPAATPNVAMADVTRPTKTALPRARKNGINRYLMLALCITVLPLAAGAGYMWHIDSTSDIQPPSGIDTTAPTTPAPEIIVTDSIESTPASHPMRIVPPVKNSLPKNPIENSPVQIQPQQTELLDPLLENAYLAYRSGKPDLARQLYLDMLVKDARNIDALLGLAVIAQQGGEDISAAQHYEHVLAMDPRNAVANAGMSALITDEHSESRLKILLHQQGNSAALHFALGNLYAKQSRWSEAQQAYFNAYVLDTGNSGSAFNLAVSLDRIGQYKLAAQHYQRALQLDHTLSAGFDHAQIEQRVLELTH